MRGSLNPGGLTLEDTDLGNEFVFTLHSAGTGLRGGCSPVGPLLCGVEERLELTVG